MMTLLHWMRSSSAAACSSMWYLRTQHTTTTTCNKMWLHSLKYFSLRGFSKVENNKLKKTNKPHFSLFSILFFLHPNWTYVTTKLVHHHIVHITMSEVEGVFCCWMLVFSMLWRFGLLLFTHTFTTSVSLACSVWRVRPEHRPNSTIISLLSCALQRESPPPLTSQLNCLKSVL